MTSQPLRQRFKSPINVSRNTLSRRSTPAVEILMDIKDEIGEGSIGVGDCAHCCRRIRDEVSGAVRVIGWEENFLSGCSCEALGQVSKGSKTIR
jgi:hypothetical protein